MPALTKDMITKPALWKLAMELRPRTLEVVLSSPYDEGPLIYQQLPLAEGMSQLAAFEELVYQNPLLLSDFAKVDLLIDTNKFLLAPASIEKPETHALMLEAIWPDQGLESCALPIEGTSDCLVMGVEAPLLAFIRRTFLDTRPGHPLSSLAAWFAPQCQTGEPHKIFAHFRDDSVAVAAFSDGVLRAANIFAAATPDDAVYFILAAAQSTGISLDQSEILMSGDMRMREKAIPGLRPFAKRVMPAIFPSEALRAGAQAVKAPFELITLI